MRASACARGIRYRRAKKRRFSRTDNRQWKLRSSPYTTPIARRAAPSVTSRPGDANLALRRG